MAESLGLGMKFQIEGQTQGTFTDVPGVASIQLPELDREEVEVEDLNPPGGIKRRLLGVRTIGNLTVTLNYDPDEPTHQQLKTLQSAGGTKKVRVIRASTGSGVEFTVEVKRFAQSEIREGDVQQVEVEMVPQGEATDVTGA